MVNALNEKNVFQSQSNGELSLSDELVQQKSEKLKKLGYTLTGIGILSFAVTFGLGCYFTKRAMRPVDTINQIAEEIAKDGLSKRIESPEKLGELSPLAFT